MAQYLLVLRDDLAADGWAALSQDEMQAVIERYMQWTARIAEAGKLVGGEKLRDGEGRVARRGAGGLAVVDGPFAEAKEVVGGYFLLEARDYDEVLELIEDCPHLAFGSVEIRAVEPMPAPVVA